MKTATVEYNEKDIYTMKILTDSLNTGENRMTKQRNSAFKTALQETLQMSVDISQNGINGYKTLDDLLNED